MRNFYEAIVEKMQSGVLVTDQNDQIYFINSWLVDKYGVSRKSLQGINIVDMYKVFPAGRFEEILRHYIRAKKSLEPQEFSNAAVISPAGKEAYRSGWCIPVLSVWNTGG